MKKQVRSQPGIGFAIKKFCVSAFILLLSISLSGCFMFPKEEAVLAPPLKKPSVLSYDTQDIKKRAIERKIDVTGYLVSVSQTDLSFKPKGGYLKVYNVVAGDKVKKGDVLAELDTDSLTSQIREKEIELKKALNALEKIRFKINIDGGGDRFALTEAELEVELYEVMLGNLKKELEKTRLVSPVDGDVVYIDNKVNIGDYVNAYKALIRVADPSQLQVQCSDNAGKLTEFKLGMKVDVKVNDKTCGGEVVMTPANAPLDADDATKKSIRIKADNLPANSNISDYATVSLILEKKENTIVIPRNAVMMFNGRKYVHILEDGIRKERYIETGIETITEVEVIKGLSEGEKLIIK